jgi:hypothetical protein
MNDNEIEWSRQRFQMMADGGTWAVPRSGLIFTRRGKTLVLTARMPHMPEIPITPEQLAEQQQGDYDAIAERMIAAGVEMRDETR